MDFATVGLSIIPPALAIAVERLNPINEQSLRRSAIEDLRDYENKNHQQLIDDATKFANGAVEVAGLAPTLVAAVTSGFGILHELPQPFWPSLVYVLIFVTLILFVIRLLSGQTFLHIDDRRTAVWFWGRERTLPWTSSKIVSFCIYLANLLLIVFALATYAALEKPWHYFLQGSSSG
jgi:hypothetical protein